VKRKGEDQVNQYSSIIRHTTRLHTLWKSLSNCLFTKLQPASKIDSGCTAACNAVGGVVRMSGVNGAAGAVLQVTW
jgi:hypothetical protein